jgi:glycosyltransferase involved in cell wall biosynthesis
VRILYIAVHHHVDWGAEHWLANAFERLGCKIERYDYRARRNKKIPWWVIRRQLAAISLQFQPDVVLLQRAERMPKSIPEVFSCPVVFWSTEPLIRRRDVDRLLRPANLFSWVYLHTYTCKSVIEKEFPHLLPLCSVMHNAGAIENDPGDKHRPRLAIFNRKVSQRRGEWLASVSDLVEVIEGRYGAPYFKDLRESLISVNIHFSNKSVDDFETGIFEALGSGCVVVTEKLNPRTVADMGMADAIVQVSNSTELREAILSLRDSPARVAEYQRNGSLAMNANRWDSRARQMLTKFRGLVRA